MSEVRIRLRDADANVPVEFTEDNRAYFSLPDNFRYRVTKVVEELNDIRKLKFDRTLGIELDLDRRNEAILKNYIITTDRKTSYKNVPVDIIAGTEIIGDVELIIEKRKSRRLIISITLDHNHWARRLQGIYLKDIELGSYTVSTPTPSNLHDKHIYSEGNGHWTPLVDYGTLELSGENVNGALIIPNSYWRPWLFCTHILKEIFRHAEYRFESPFFDSNLGKRLIVYLLKSNFGQDDAYLYNFSGKYRNTLGVSRLLKNQILIVNFPEQQINQKGNWQVAPIATNIHSYIGNGEVDVVCKIKIRANKLGNDKHVKLRIVGRTIKSEIAKDIIYDEKEITRQSTSEYDEIELQAEGITLFDTMKLQVEIDSNDPTANIQFGDISELDIICNRAYFQSGETYQINSIINEEILAIDWIKEMSEKLQLKTETNIARGLIEAYIPYTIETKGEVIVGYMKESKQVDLTERVLPETDNIDYPTEGTRFTTYGFAESDDEELKNQKLDVTVFDRIIDNGESIPNNDTTSRKLEIIQATRSTLMAEWKVKRMSDPFFGLQHEYMVQLSKPLFLPVLRGEELDKYNWDCGTRILISQGTVHHGFTFSIPIFGSISTISDRKILLGNIETSLIPSAFQEPFWISAESNNVNAHVIWSDESLAYNIERFSNGFSLYSQIIKKTQHELNNEPLVEVLIDLKEDEVRHFDKRAYYIVPVDGRPKLCRLEEIRDFIYFENIPTPCVFRGVSQLGDDAGIFEPEEATCMNVAIIYGTIDDNCIKMGITGNMNAAVHSVVFYYQVDGQAQQIAGNTSTLTAEVCDIDDTTKIWAQVTFAVISGCPAVFTQELTLSPCVTDDPDIEIEFFKNENDQKAAIATVGGDIKNTYLVESAFYTMSGIRVAYTVGDVVLLTGDIEFEINFDFTDACDPVKVIKALSIDGDTNVTNPTASVELVNKFGTYTFKRIGTTPALGDFEDYVIYRTSANGSFVRWDEMTAVRPPFIECYRILLPLNQSGELYRGPLVTL